ncbi:MAG: mechanosensitive ion channel family protein, partial [Acidimicrobiales bacterium]
MDWIRNTWLDNSFLPALVLLLGAGLIVRLAHWLGAIRRREIDNRIRKAIESGLVASEGAKRSRAVSEAVEWVVVALTYFLATILALDRLGLPLTTLVAPATVIGIGLGFGAQQMV